MATGHTYHSAIATGAVEWAEDTKRGLRDMFRFVREAVEVGEMVHDYMVAEAEHLMGGCNGYELQGTHDEDMDETLYPEIEITGAGKLETVLEDMLESASADIQIDPFLEVYSFGEVGIFTDDKGLVLRFSDGSEYHLTIQKTR